MSVQDVVAPMTSPFGPAGRVAVVRRVGTAARVAAADVVRQLRTRGCMVIELDTPRAWSLLSEGTDAAGRYDLVVAVGDEPSGATVAAATGAPLLVIDRDVPDDLIDHAARTVATQTFDQRHLMEVAATGHPTFVAWPTVIRSEHGGPIWWQADGAGRCDRPQVEVVSCADGRMSLQDGPGQDGFTVETLHVGAYRGDLVFRDQLFLEGIQQAVIRCHPRPVDVIDGRRVAATAGWAR